MSTVTESKKHGRGKSPSAARAKAKALAVQFEAESDLVCAVAKSELARTLAFACVFRDDLLEKVVCRENLGEAGRAVPALLSQIAKLADRLGLSNPAEEDDDG